MLRDRNHRLVFGVDIFPQDSPQAKTAPRYALVILVDGLLSKRYGGVSKSRLIHLIHSFRPDVLAVDNVYELVSSTDELRRLVSALPPEIEIVQVTGSPMESVPLQTAAIVYGMSLPPKLSPMEGAEASARLAELGAGCEIRTLENETRILVSKNVSLGPGGSSQSRYRRKVHNTILATTKQVEESLRRAGVDYDLFVEKSDFGLERGEFTAYAPRMALYGIVKPKHGSYVKVVVNAVFKERVEFAPRRNLKDADNPVTSTNRRKLIVGVDPGTTCGLAVVDFDSKPLLIDSHRGLTRGEITRIVMRLGEPVVVASDVIPTPEFVTKLARAVNAVLYVPEALLERSEKQEIAETYSRQHGVEVKDTHSRDALAAAVKAFQHYKNKLEQVDAHAKEVGIPIPSYEVKAMVVRGYPMHKAIELLSPKPKGEVETTPQRLTTEITTSNQAETEIKALRERASLHEERAKRLEELNVRLKQRIESLEAEVSRLRFEAEAMRMEQTLTIRREREYQTLQREMENLRNQLSKAVDEVDDYRTRLERLSHYRALESKEEVLLLKPVEAFTKEGLEKAFRLHNINRGDVIILMDASGGGVSTAEELAKRGIKAVVCGTPMAHQAEEALTIHGILTIPIKDVSVEWVEGYPYTKRLDMERGMRKAAERGMSEAKSELRDIVSTYKEERARALQKL